MYFTVIHRNPAFNHAAPEFQGFMLNLENLQSSCNIFKGDFNAHFQLWWPDGDTTDEGTDVDELFTKLGLSQILSEPTNFQPHKNPSCIELLVIRATEHHSRASLDPYCYHQIMYCKVNCRIPPPLPFNRKMWH